MLDIKKFNRRKKQYEKAQKLSDPRNDPRFRVTKKKKLNIKKTEEDLKKPLAKTMTIIAFIILILFMMLTKTGIGNFINFDTFR